MWRRWLLVAGGVFAAAPTACGGRLDDGTAGAGGTDINLGTGGSASGGSGATGGSAATGGGTSTGGASASGGTGSGVGGSQVGSGGAMGGTGGHCSLTPCPDPALPYCYPPTLLCVECLDDRHCGSAGRCIDQACVGPCRTDADCPAGQRCGAQGSCEVGLSCDGRACGPVNILGLIDLPGCCPANPTGTGCGLDMSSVNALSPTIPTGCLEREQAGTVEPTCPSTTIDVPTAGTIALAGCCRPDGVCGVLFDLTGLLDLTSLTAELDFGCVEGWRLGLPRQACGGP